MLGKNGFKVFDHILPHKLTLKFLGDHSLTPCIVVFNDIRSVSVIFNMLMQIIPTHKFITSIQSISKF
jgi:hypothetical protein